MTKIFPRIENIDGIPFSEKVVYKALMSLPDTFTIFHSVQWFSRGSRKSIWKENDFLILSQKYGMLVLEVKGGNVEYKDGVFVQTNTLTKKESILSEKKRNDPLTQAIDGKYHYRDLISEILKDEMFSFNIDACVCFPSCKVKNTMDSFPLKYKEIKDAILDYNSIQNSSFELEIKKVYDFYNAYKNTSVNDEQYKRIKRSIAQDFRLIAVPALRKGELDDAFIRLTNEQVGLLDYISEQEVATIQGVAGTGKTIIAIEAAKRFASEGNKVLFLCFNSLLFHYLKNTYPIESVDYFNIHTFLTKHITGNFSDIRDRVEGLYKIDHNDFDYDAIIIDEAQDFDNYEILYFKDYIKEKDGRLLIFFDKNQLLTTDVVPEWIVNSECKLLLTKNCRNTREIAITSHNVIGAELKQRIKMVSGDETELLFVSNDYEDQIYKLIDFYIKKGYDPSDITILSINSEYKSLLNGIDNIHNLKLSRIRNKKDVFVTTASRFKGLESRVIVVIDIDHKCFDDEATKRLFYVACSRATQQLALIIKDEKQNLNKICESIKLSSAFNSKGKIAMKIKAHILEFEDDSK